MNKYCDHGRHHQYTQQLARNDPLHQHDHDQYKNDNAHLKMTNCLDMTTFNEVMIHSQGCIIVRLKVFVNRRIVRINAPARHFNGILALDLHGRQYGIGKLCIAHAGLSRRSPKVKIVALLILQSHGGCRVAWIFFIGHESTGPQNDIIHV